MKLIESRFGGKPILMRRQNQTKDDIKALTIALEKQGGYMRPINLSVV